MSGFVNPALTSFVAMLGSAKVLAQVAIRRFDGGFELRHVADLSCSAQELRLIRLEEVRGTAQFTATGAFRPLKSAPDLQSGWRLRVESDSQLHSALDQLYPGAVADWYAAQTPRPPVTHYRQFAQRQSGMYRITQRLEDRQAAPVIRAGCHERFCLKQRLWTVPGLAADSTDQKSQIPCLEPCPLLLEFARQAMRIEQEEKIRIEMAASDAASMERALAPGMEVPAGEIPEAEFSAARNPRRLQLVLEKLAELPKKIKTEPQK